MLPDLMVLAPASEILPDTSYYARPALLPGATPELLARRFSGFSAEVIDTVRVSVDVGLLRVEEINTLSGLYRSPAGDFVLRANTPIGPRLARFRADGSFFDVIEPPTAEVVYPSERDVEEYIDGWVRVFREKPSESQVAEYRSRMIGDFPKVPMHLLVQFDSRGRLWVISTRPVDGGTFVDVYDDTGRVESHVLRGRVRGIQIVDSLLVAFSEYGVTEFGLPDQRLDWYRWTATATANAACAKAGSAMWPRGSTATATANAACATAGSAVWPRDAGRPASREGS